MPDSPVASLRRPYPHGPISNQVRCDDRTAIQQCAEAFGQRGGAALDVKRFTQQHGQWSEPCITIGKDSDSDSSSSSALEAAMGAQSDSVGTLTITDQERGRGRGRRGAMRYPASLGDTGGRGHHQPVA